MSTEIPVDDETRAALLLFNERLDATRAQERAAKRIAKAERAKDEAARRVRNVGNDTSATPEQKAEAEEAYKAAVAEFNHIKENPDEEPKKPAPVAQDDEPSETSADEEPAESTTASDESDESE